VKLRPSVSPYADFFTSSDFFMHLQLCTVCLRAEHCHMTFDCSTRSSAGPAALRPMRYARSASAPEEHWTGTNATCIRLSVRGILQQNANCPWQQLSDPLPAPPHLAWLESEFSRGLPYGPMVRRRRDVGPSVSHFAVLHAGFVLVCPEHALLHHVIAESAWSPPSDNPLHQPST
jgi:hypothetical protein